MARSYSVDDACDALQSLSASCERTQWVVIGQAAKDAGIGFDAFDAWSSGGQGYKGEKDTKAQWRSFRPGAVTAGTLFHLAREGGWTPRWQDEADVVPASPRKSSASRKAQDRRPTTRGASDPDADALEGSKLHALIDRIMAQCTPADTLHGYLVRKGVSADALQEIDAPTLNATIGYTIKARGDTPLTGKLLVVGLYPVGGPEEARPLAIEFIDCAGNKCGLSRVKRAGLAWSPNRADHASPRLRRVVIAEGMATTASLAASWPEQGAIFLSASSASNLKNVAHSAAQTWPLCEIAVCGDAGNGSADAQSAAAAVGGLAVIPHADVLPEGGKDWNDAVSHRGAAAVRDLLSSALCPRTLVTWVHPHGDRPVIEFVLPGLPRGAVGMLSGPGGVGKTMFALQLLSSLSIGRSVVGDAFPAPWWNAVSDARVALLAGEDEVAIVQSRMMDIGLDCEMTDTEFERLSHAFEAHSYVGEDLRLLISERGSVMEAAFAQWVLRLCARNDLVVIDPLVRLHDAQENDNTAAAALIRLLSRIGRQTGCTILVLHHFSKAGTSRGASAFATSVRWAADLAPLNADEAAMTTNPADIVKLHVVKHNYMGALEPVFFERNASSGTLRARSALPHVPPTAAELPRHAAASSPRTAINAPTARAVAYENDPFDDRPFE